MGASEASSGIRLAVIGLGRWGPNHVRNFRRLLGVREVVAVDHDPECIESVRRRFPNLKTASNYSSVLDDVDAVVVATPTSTHLDICANALSSGKHVFCEKPLCKASEDARFLADMARENEVVLMTGFVFLFNAGILKVKDLLGEGELGSIRYISATRTNLGPVRQDVNAAYDLAAHDISICNWLVGGPPDSVSANGADFLQDGLEDVAFLTLCYPDGILANIHASWLNPKKVRQMTVVGTDKMLTWDDLHPRSPVAVYDMGVEADRELTDYGEFLRLSTWDNEIRIPRLSPEEPLHAQAKAFMQAIREGSLGRCGPEFSVDVVRTLEAATRSMRQSGQEVALEGG